MTSPRLLSLVLLTSTVLACGDDDGTADTTTATTTGTPASSTAESTESPATTSTSEGSTSPTTTTGPEPGTTTGTDPDATSDDGNTTTAFATASAVLEPRSGSTASGGASFVDNGDGTASLAITLMGVLPPGTHALHIHVNPDCSAEDGTSAGDHWNPAGTMLGELGTVEIDEDGTGLFVKSDAWSIGTGLENDVVGRSIIIHGEPDGGPRIACGVITLD